MKKNVAAEWDAYLSDLGIDQKYVIDYIESIKTFIAFGVPPIFEDVHLGLLLGRDIDTIYNIIYGTNDFYRTFTIRKRSGGRRVIVSPYPSLLEAQKWILVNILNKVAISDCASGFRAGFSIRRNAEIHCGRPILLKLDVQDFFPSISLRRIIAVFRELGYSQGLAFILGRLCTLDGRLPQGAATSPALSNIICRQMDGRIYGLCKSANLRYTGYADDISVSGKSMRPGIKSLIEEIVEASGFKINERKTRICFSTDKKIVTGLDITSGTPRVTRSFRRDLQRDVYFVWSGGLSAHLSRRKIFNPHYIEHLEGRVAFWASIEPNSRQMERCRRRVKSLRVALSKS